MNSNKLKKKKKSPEVLNIMSFFFFCLFLLYVVGEDNKRFKRKPTMIPMNATKAAKVKEKPVLPLRYLLLFSKSCTQMTTDANVGQWRSSLSICCFQTNKFQVKMDSNQSFSKPHKWKSKFKLPSSVVKFFSQNNSFKCSQTIIIY